MIFSRSSARRAWSKRSAIQRRDHAVSASDASGPRRALSLVVAAPQLAHVLVRDGRHGRRQLPGPRQEIVVGDHLDDQPPRPRRRGVDVVAGEAHPPRPVDADQLGQPDRHAATGHDAHTGVRVGEAGPLRGDEEVAAHGELEPAGDGRAVDGADHGGPRGAAGSRSVRRLALALLLDRAGSVASDLRSMPAQKAGSAPVSTMQPTSSRASSSVMAASSSRVELGRDGVARLGPVQRDRRHTSSTSTSTSISVPPRHVAGPCAIGRPCRGPRAPGLRRSRPADRPGLVERAEAQPSMAVTPRSTRCQV